MIVRRLDSTLSGLLVALLATAVLAGCQPAAEAPPADAPAPAAEDADARAAGAVDLERYRLVDLTYPFDEETLYWPTSPSGFELEELHRGPTPAGFFYSAYRLCAPEHGGTHLDAPVHFAERGQAADEIPIERLVGPAVVLDVAEQAAADPDYRLTVADVQGWEARHGPVPEGSIVLLHTGWGRRWPDRKAYLGDDTPGDASNLHFPSYGAEAARYLVGERRVAVLGVDTASIDHGPAAEFPVHQVAAAADVPGLENVANLGELPPAGAWVFALPMKIGGGSGGPVRIVALVPRPRPARSG